MKDKRSSAANALLGLFALVIVGGAGWAAVEGHRGTDGASGRPEPIPSRLIPVANARVKGRADAPVIVVEFSDFQCPACGVFARNTLPLITKQFIETGQIRMFFMHEPLPMHAFAIAAAEAAECAGEEGRFWELHDQFFGHQKEIDGVGIRRLAEQAGVDGAASGRFIGCLAGAQRDKVAGDAALARELGVSSTPTFFFGRMEDGGVRVVSRFSGTRPAGAFADAIAEVGRLAAPSSR